MWKQFSFFCCWKRDKPSAASNPNRHLLIWDGARYAALTEEVTCNRRERKLGLADAYNEDSLHCLLTKLNSNTMRTRKDSSWLMLTCCGQQTWQWSKTKVQAKNFEEQFVFLVASMFPWVLLKVDWKVWWNDATFMSCYNFCCVVQHLDIPAYMTWWISCGKCQKLNKRCVLRVCGWTATYHPRV